MAKGAIPIAKNNKAAVNSSDTNPGFLEDKIKSSDGSVSITVGSCNCELDLSVVGVSGVIEEWVKYTVDFSNAGLQTGTNDATFSIATGLPEGTTILSTKKKQSASWSGGSITGVDLQVGYNTDFDTAFRISSSTIPPRGITESPTYASLSQGTIDVRFTFTGSVDTDLTQGSVDIWIKTAILD